MGSFEQWAKRKLDKAKRTKPTKGIFSQAPQCEWLENTEGQIIIDHVFRFENLEADFKALCQIAGLEAKLPTINATPGKIDYQSYYSPDLKAFVEDFYRRDLEELNYTF